MHCAVQNLALCRHLPVFREFDAGKEKAGCTKRTLGKNVWLSVLPASSFHEQESTIEWIQNINESMPFWAFDFTSLQTCWLVFKLASLLGSNRVYQKLSLCMSYNQNLLLRHVNSSLQLTCKFDNYAWNVGITA